MWRRVGVVICLSGTVALGGCSFSSDGPGAASLAQRVRDGDAPAGLVVADDAGRRNRDAEELNAMLLTSQDFDRHTSELSAQARYLVDAPIVLCGGVELAELAGDASTVATGFGRYDDLSVLGTGTPEGDPDGEWFTQHIWRFESSSDAAEFVDAAEAAFACGTWVADAGAPELVSRVVAAVPTARVGDDGFAVVKARGPIVTTYEVVRLGSFVTLVTDSLVVAGASMPAFDELLGDQVQTAVVCIAARRVVEQGRPAIGHDVDLSSCGSGPPSAAPPGTAAPTSTTSTAPPGQLSP